MFWSTTLFFSTYLAALLSPALGARRGLTQGRLSEAAEPPSATHQGFNLAELRASELIPPDKRSEIMRALATHLMPDLQGPVSEVCTTGLDKVEGRKWVRLALHFGRPD